MDRSSKIKEIIANFATEAENLPDDVINQIYDGHLNITLEKGVQSESGGASKQEMSFGPLPEFDFKLKK